MATLRAEKKTVRKFLAAHCADDSRGYVADNQKYDKKNIGNL
jgi:hypothetical protein